MVGTDVAGFSVAPPLDVLSIIGITLPQAQNWKGVQSLGMATAEGSRAGTPQPGPAAEPSAYVPEYV